MNGEKFLFVLVHLVAPLDEDDCGGVGATAVQPNGNAERAGVTVGEQLLAVNNIDLSAASLEEVLEAIMESRGRVVNLRFALLRDA